MAGEQPRFQNKTKATHTEQSCTKTNEKLNEKVAHHFQEIVFGGELTKKMYAGYVRRMELVIQYEGAWIPDEKPQIYSQENRDFSFLTGDSSSRS